MHPVALVLLGLLCAAAQASEPLPRGVDRVPTDAVADPHARLIVSRDNQAPNACDVKLHVDSQVVARLGPGESIGLDLPSGELSVAAALAPGGYCGGRGPAVGQSILLRPGETRQFAVRIEPDRVFLAPLLD